MSHVFDQFEGYDHDLDHKYMNKPFYDNNAFISVNSRSMSFVVKDWPWHGGLCHVYFGELWQFVTINVINSIN